MAIEWPLVRRAMLTQENLFPNNAAANCMSAYIEPAQLAIAERCIHAFCQGLKWAEECQIQGGYVGNRNFRRIFLIDDGYVLGVFDNRNPVAEPQEPLANPDSTENLVESYRRGRGNIKTLIVLEKANYRLANSEAVGFQSKFLIDAIYPAIAGIRARFSDQRNQQRWEALVNRARLTPNTEELTQGSLLRLNLLSEIYHDPQKADRFLSEHSPLRLFYDWNSPFNLEFDSDQPDTVPRRLAIEAEHARSNPHQPQDL